MKKIDDPLFVRKLLESVSVTMREAVAPIRVADNLFAVRALDSYSTIEFILALEQSLGVTIVYENLRQEDIVNIESMQAYIATLGFEIINQQ